MLVFNQQANIKNVNGAIADIFANRPAPQSTFYIYYSIDTQEIYYDNGAWILIGQGGGGQNIYNSDGTLTTNRILDGDSKSITFTDLSKYEINNINNIGLQIDYWNNKYSFGDFSGLFTNVIRILQNINTIELIADRQNINWSQITISGNKINTLFQGQSQGFNFDYANNVLEFGYNSTQGVLRLNKIGLNSFLYSIYNNLASGFFLDFGSRQYNFGQFSGGNTSYIAINDGARRILTTFQGIANGLDINQAARQYKFGNIAGGSQISLVITDSNNLLETTYGGATQGIRFDLLNREYRYGQITGGDNTRIVINDINSVINTNYQGSTNGFLLEFGNERFTVGELVRGSQSHILINNLQSRISTRFNNLLNGLDITTSYSTIGFIQGTGNANYLNITREATKIIYNAAVNGLNIEHNATAGLERYDFGKLQGAASTQYKLTLTDASCFLNYKNIFSMGCSATQGEIGFTTIGANILLNNSGVLNMRQLTQLEMNGTGITSGTSGGSSGQHLNIKINGTDYKIKLENP